MRSRTGAEAKLPKNANMSNVFTNRAAKAPVLNEDLMLTSLDKSNEPKPTKYVSMLGKSPTKLHSRVATAQTVSSR